MWQEKLCLIFYIGKEGYFYFYFKFKIIIQYNYIICIMYM